MSKHRIYFQYAIDDKKSLPDESLLDGWIQQTLFDNEKNYEITVRFVEPNESQSLNNEFRQQNKPTNVLSFPIHEKLEDGYLLLGDIALCMSVIECEALEQDKTIEAHVAHMLVHSCLHLMGYDHETDSEASLMEEKEIALLAKLNFANPYLEKG